MSPATRVTTCDLCGQEHEAIYSHEGRWGDGPIFAVVCPLDGLTGFYNLHAVTVAL